MSTDYSFYIHTDLSAEQAAARIAHAVGTSYHQTELEEDVDWTDEERNRWDIEWPGLPSVEALPPIDSDDPLNDGSERNYGVVIWCDVPYSIDNQEARDAALRLGEEIAKLFETLATYQDLPIGENDGPGTPMRWLDELPEFVAEGFAADGNGFGAFIRERF